VGWEGAMAGQGRDKGKDKIEGGETDDKGKCGNCSKEVLKEGIECEVCDRWFHCKCEGVSAGTYRALEQDKSLHWYCSGCSSGVVSMWKKIQEGYDKMEAEIVKIKEELEGLKAQNVKVGQLEVEIGKGRTGLMNLEVRVSKLESDKKKGEQQKTQEVLKEVDDLKQTFTQIVNEQQEERNKEMKEKDKEIQHKMFEVMEREKRKNNLVFMGIKESTEKEEKEFMDKIMEILVEEVVISYDIIGRVGRKGAGDRDVIDKPRPLRICINDVGHKRLVLSRGKNLKGSEFKQVFVAPDLTRMQQEEDKKLREKLKELRGAGKENIRIIKGEIVCFEERGKVVLFSQRN
jgi:hypothetical protein